MDEQDWQRKKKKWWILTFVVLLITGTMSAKLIHDAREMEKFTKVLEDRIIPAMDDYTKRQKEDTARFNEEQKTGKVLRQIQGELRDLEKMRKELSEELLEVRRLKQSSAPRGPRNP